jgi:hypothetical protein
LRLGPLETGLADRSHKATLARPERPLARFVAWALRPQHHLGPRQNGAHLRYVGAYSAALQRLHQFVTLQRHRAKSRDFSLKVPSMRLDLLHPAAERVVLVLEGIGDDKVWVNSSSLDHPLVILPDQAIDIVAIEKKVMVGRTARLAYWLNHDPSGLTEVGYGPATK